MADARGLARLLAIREGTRPSSGNADRTRPPYVTPVPGAAPANIQSARMLEQGYHRLPPAYQAMLRETPSRPFLTGTMAEGQNLAGFLERTPKGVTLMADTPATAAHELIHEIADRQRGAGAEYILGQSWGGPHPEVEEQLARHIGGNQSGAGAGGFYGLNRLEQARDLDAEATFMHSLSPLERLLAVIGFQGPGRMTAP